MSRRVLVVEDDAWQADMMATQLTANGFQTTIATDALAAFASIDQSAPGAIVLDIMLPGPNGIAFLHELRSHADTADVPVIVCTAQQLSLSSLRPYGVTNVLDKTAMQPQDVVVAVREVLA